MSDGRLVEPISMDELQLSELRDERVRETVARCWDGSAFYRGRLEAAGVEPGDIRTVADLEQLRRSFSARTTSASCRSARGRSSGTRSESTSAPRSRMSSASRSTSGTTGTPTFYAFTERDVATTDELWARAFRQAGVRRGDSVLHCFGLSMFLAGVPVVRALERMGARPIPVGAEAGTERILRIADLVRPRVLACTPSYAQYLAEQVPKVLGRPTAELGIEIILCAGEPGAGLPEVRAGLQQAFGAKLYDLLGGAHGVMCCSCDVEPYAGMHVLGEDCRHHDPARRPGDEERRSRSSRARSASA